MDDRTETRSAMRILCVCLGNICRSPTAEAALREAVAQAGLDDVVEVESAGTGGWHVGHPPDPRMAKAAAAAGLRLDCVARRVEPADFATFDWLLAMDRSNESELLALAPDDAARAKVRRFRDFEPDPDGPDVPDPYYEGNFDRIVDIARAGAQGVVRAVRAELDA